MQPCRELSLTTDGSERAVVEADTQGIVTYTDCALNNNALVEWSLENLYEH